MRIKHEDHETGLTVSTVSPFDKPEYETAISHPGYNQGAWIIVEEYETESEANDGHNKWVKTMTTEPLPEKLQDVSTCLSSLLMLEEDRLQYRTPMEVKKTKVV